MKKIAVFTAVMLMFLAISASAATKDVLTTPTKKDKYGFHGSISAGYVHHGLAIIINGWHKEGLLLSLGGFYSNSSPDYTGTVSQQEANQWGDPITNAEKTIKWGMMFGIGTYKKVLKSAYIHGTVDIIIMELSEDRYDPMHILSNDGNYSIDREMEGGLGLTGGFVVDNILVNISYSTIGTGISVGYIFF